MIFIKIWIKSKVKIAFNITENIYMPNNFLKKSKIRIKSKTRLHYIHRILERRNIWMSSDFCKIVIKSNTRLHCIHIIL